MPRVGGRERTPTSARWNPTPPARCRRSRPRASILLAVRRRRAPSRRRGAAAGTRRGAVSAAGAADRRVARQAERLLTEVEQWSGKSEADERDYFYQKSALFTWMLDLMPQSAVRSGRCAPSSSSCATPKPTSAGECSGSRSSTGCSRSRRDRPAPKYSRRWKSRTSRCSRCTPGSNESRPSADLILSFLRRRSCLLVADGLQAVPMQPTAARTGTPPTTDGCPARHRTRAASRTCGARAGDVRSSPPT